MNTRNSRMLSLAIAAVLISGVISQCDINSTITILTMEKKLEGFDLVVTGMNIQHVPNQIDNKYQDSKFRVTCVLKGDNKDINEMITIEHVKPMRTCGAITSTNLKTGVAYIIGLKRHGSNYRLDEIDNIQTVAFVVTESKLQRALGVCGLQTLAPPSDNKNAALCPTKTNLEACNGCRLKAEILFLSFPFLVPVLGSFLYHSA